MENCASEKHDSPISMRYDMQIWDVGDIDAYCSNFENDHGWILQDWLE